MAWPLNQGRKAPNDVGGPSRKLKCFQGQGCNLCAQSGRSLLAAVLPPAYIFFFLCNAIRDIQEKDSTVYVYPKPCFASARLAARLLHVLCQSWCSCIYITPLELCITWTHRCCQGKIGILTLLVPTPSYHHFEHLNITLNVKTKPCQSMSNKVLLPLVMISTVNGCKLATKKAHMNSFFSDNLLVLWLATWHCYVRSWDD